MRTLLHFRWLLAFLLGTGTLGTAQASHLEGGDITYSSVASTTAGVPRYHVAIRNFINVAGTLIPISPLPSLTLTASRAGCGAAAPNALTVQVPLTQTANGAPLYCGQPPLLYKVALYELDLDLPNGQWMLSSGSEYRYIDIVNITNPASQKVLLTAYLDNTVTLPDSSPKFESVLKPSILAAAPTPHSFSAFDLDGDSLSYELVLPYGECNQLVTGTPAPHFTVAAGTGALLPTAAGGAQGAYNIAVRVREYRKFGSRWGLLGYVMRDMLYLRDANTGNSPPTFTTTQVNGGPWQATNPVVAVLPGQTVTVGLQATDPDAGQTLRFVSEAPAVVPGLSLTPLAGSAAGVLLTWQVPASLPPGRYAIAVGVVDNGCYYSASEERTLVFVVGSNAALAARAGTLANAEAYPTPFREQVQFKTEPNQAVVLFDALGREVARLSSAADGLVRWQPAASLPAGLYFARAAADGQPLARLLRAE